MKSVVFPVLVSVVAAAALCVSPIAAEESAVTLGIDSLTSGVPGSGTLTVSDVNDWLANSENHVTLQVSLPLGMSLGEKQIKGLQDNPLTRAKIELGRQLYFDTRLSADNTISCASCHHPQNGYARHTPFGVGIEGQMGGRNSPVSYNRILSDLQFWDGRADTLEAQAVGPIASPIEMGNTHENCVKTLAAIPGYALQFETIFGDSELTIDMVGLAIASFERAIVTGPTPFDYYESYQRFAELDPDDLAEIKDDDPEIYAEYLKLQGDIAANPMSVSAVRGRNLFFGKKVGCSNCHVGANLTDEQYHNLGVGMDTPSPDLGRYAVTKVEKDKGAFKTPTIRNVADSGPFMHDGSMATLEEVVEHYNKGGTPNQWLSEKITPLKLTPQEKIDLVEFMRACSGSFPHVATGRLPE